MIDSDNAMVEKKLRVEFFKQDLVNFKSRGPPDKEQIYKPVGSPQISPK